MSVNRSVILFLLFIVPSFVLASVGFDGTDDYLDCGTGTDIDKNTFTLTAWINPNIDSEPTSRLTIVSHFDDGGLIHAEMYLDDGTPIGATTVLACDVLDGGGVTHTAYADLLDTTGWKHVACTWDITGAELNVYVDAQQGTPDSISDPTAGSAGTFYIASSFGPSIFFQGEITDVNYYNRVLSLSEIETLAYSRMRSNVVPTDSNATHWPLDDLADSTTVKTNTFLNRASPGTSNCSGTSSTTGGTAYADFIRYR